MHMVKSTYESVVPVHDLNYLIGDKMAIFYGSSRPRSKRCAPVRMAGSAAFLTWPEAAARMYDAVVRDNDAACGSRIWNRLLPLVHLYTHQLIGPVSDLATYRSILNTLGTGRRVLAQSVLSSGCGAGSPVEDPPRKTNWLDPEHALDTV